MWQPWQVSGWGEDWRLPILTRQNRGGVSSGGYRHWLSRRARSSIAQSTWQTPYRSRIFGNIAARVAGLSSSWALSTFPLSLCRTSAVGLAPVSARAEWSVMPVPTESALPVDRASSGFAFKSRLSLTYPVVVKSFCTRDPYGATGKKSDVIETRRTAPIPSVLEAVRCKPAEPQRLRIEKTPPI